MNPIDEIRARLAKYPDVRSETGPDSITVLPVDATGFPATLSIADGEYIVAFSGWHEHFSDAHEAMDCLVFGLSDGCRLKVHKRGTVEHRWTVESRSNGAWGEDSTAGLLFFPFWRRLQIEYRQNRLLPSASHERSMGA
jgi:hypothetical protein